MNRGNYDNLAKKFENYECEGQMSFEDMEWLIQKNEKSKDLVEEEEMELPF